MSTRISEVAQHFISEMIALVRAGSSDTVFIRWADRWTNGIERLSISSVIVAGHASAAGRFAGTQELLIAAANEYAVAHTAASLLIYQGNAEREEAHMEWCRKRLAGETQLPILAG